MNTLISPETKQLLFDKGWRYELSESYDPELGGTRVNHSLGEQRWNEGKDLTYVDITIAEVVMWLYEKHGIWIYSYPVQPLVLDDKEYPKTVWVVKCLSMNQVMFEKFIDAKNGLAINHHNSPTEAYEAAIEYTLNNLI